MPAEEHSLHFGRFELRPRQRKLLDAGRPVVLGSRAFDLLTALVDDAGSLLTKHALLDLVWPGLVVEESNLHVQVSTLRKALGPDAIATVPGHGYRFVWPVQRGGENAPVAKPTLTTASSPAAPAVHKRPGNLPLPPSALLGRDDDIRTLAEMLDTRRLVTLVGPGGMGKTRLALEAAAARTGHADGVWWVELAGLEAGAANDPTMLATTLVAPLGLALERELPAPQALARALEPLDALLVLDNAEHLLKALAPLMHQVLATAPRLRLLVTSQEPLLVAGEQVLRLGALAVPPEGLPLPEALRHGALALLVQRAQAADPRFQLQPAVLPQAVAICSQLDGLPLALEMAGARLPQLGVDGVQSRLAERLRLLAGARGLPQQRHQTLRAALDWSHGLLTTEQQTVWRRLAVFVGSFGLDAAQQVAADEHGALDAWAVLDHLGALVDKSLVQSHAEHHGGDAPRYRLLDSARLYASERLAAAGETAGVQQRFVRAMAALAGSIDTMQWTRRDAELLRLHGADVDNLLAALDGALAQAAGASAEASANDSNVLALAACIFTGAGHVLPLAGREIELMARADALQRVLPKAPPAAAGAASRLLGMLQMPQHRQASRETLETAVALLRQALEQDPGAPPETAALPLYAGLAALAQACALTGKIVEAETALAEADRLPPPAGGWPLRAMALRASAPALVAYFDDRPEQALAAARAALPLAEALGAERDAAMHRANAAAFLIELNRPEEAMEAMHALLPRLAGPRWGKVRSMVLGNFIAVSLLLQRHAMGWAFAREGVALSRRHGYGSQMLDNVAVLAARDGQPELAARLIGHADARYAASGDTRVADQAEIIADARQRVQHALGGAQAQQLMAEGAALGADAIDALLEAQA